MKSATGKGWASLSLYESPELLRRFAKARTGRGLGDAKAREIATHFSQGREYFRSAAEAAELVRPLILYYGAMSLARGAVLFLDPDKSKVEADHGLDAVGWKDLNSEPASVPDLKTKTKRGGTFPELARVTGNLEWCMVRNHELPGEVPVSSTGPDLSPGTGVSIKEALGQVPDIAEIYERTFEEHPRRLRCEVLVTGLPEPDSMDAFSRHEIPPDRHLRRHAWLGIVPTHAGLPPKDWVVDALDEGRVAARETGPRLLYFARRPMHRVAEAHLFDLYYDSGTAEHPRLDMPVTASSSGEEYLKLPTDDGVVLSTLLALHVVAFAAGTLVRYHPGYWAAVVGRTKGDSIAPILSAGIDAVEERYPALILGAIGG